MSKRIRKPAELLTVSEILAIESVCINDVDVHKRVIAGNILFCFLSAARWSDARYISNVEFSNAGDLHLVEADTAHHKTSRVKELQHELLPYTALGRISSDQSWSVSWRQARDLSGTSESGFFMREKCESAADWSSSSMSTAEATGWLAKFLVPEVGVERARKLTIHGLKGTMLSWASKSLLFSPDDQLVLGHHVHAQYKSSMVYSRDQIRLCKIIKDMQKFLKLSPRSAG